MINRTDLITGAALIIVGAAMAWEAQGFPKLGGMAFGPDLFPTIAAAGLMISGVGIVAEGATSARRAMTGTDGADRLVWPVIAVLLIVAFFALALPFLGFHITAAITTLAAVRVFGGGWFSMVALAIVIPVVVHVVFYTIMRVPLPWGLLTPIAW